MSKQLSFIILEDHSLVLNAFKSLIKEMYADSQVACFKSIAEIENSNINFNSFDLFISDLNLHENTANDFLGKVKKEFEIPILVVSMENSYIAITDVQEKGVNGFLLKDDFDVFPEAIEKVRNGATFYSPKVQKTLDSVNASEKPLTKRQLDVLKHWNQSKSNADIADVLNVSVETVKSHKKNIREILGLKNVYDINQFLIQKNII